MANPVNIEAIIAQVDQLTDKERRELLERLSELRKRIYPENPAAQVRLSSLAGSGATVWDGKADIDHFLEEERQW